MTAPDVVVERRGEILIITLNRPKANAIDAATSRALHDAFMTLSRETGLRVAVVTGAGTRFFSAGWDLKAADHGEDHGADHGSGGFAGLTQLFGLTKPVIAAVNGAAHGGGVELILAAHLAVASEDACFSFPEARLGILPDAGGLNRLPTRMPRALALELLLTSREFTASEALQWGLVNRVVPAGDVLDAAIELAEQVCRAAPLSVAAILRAAERTQGLCDADAFEVLAGMREVSGVSTTADAQEGMRARAERRPPRWKSR